MEPTNEAISGRSDTVDLEAVNKSLSTTVQELMVELSKADAEIERLRNVLENVEQAQVLQGEVIIDADKEIERLRAALKLIADGKETEPRILASAMLEGEW